ncbi:dihydrofolate reductase [Scheffersomyces stipitis CBS 6054]|uniref:Dihydrofolate reductase n=1 Tax=Scheffersomyces stipitis (strain ATCC 58785 / CBS 6054 / NBRC 10063 / NRRL Y-11545) TaxID=322104 RepID=A3GEV3_PICST|nr:dihydrofolate reductase [Scheffersomyces stipitis CBS 6054]EAZ63651.2 dihydrofolate reductase [Scheffersomyces stipitis CBS 6054]KAG2731848.1 hypothetical protein G9P44_005435 [Scheffersomyces stipitis]
MSNSTSNGRILCLPGFLQSVRVFAEKTTRLKELFAEKKIELEYLDPPRIIESLQALPYYNSLDKEEADVMWKKTLAKDANKCWFLVKDPHLYYGFEEAVQYIIDHIRVHGPYDGILGFSQGCVMATTITNTIHELLPSHPHFKVSILAAGFAMTGRIDDEEMAHNDHSYHPESLEEFQSSVRLLPAQERYFTPPKDNFNTKLFFIFGRNDFVVPPIRTKYLAHLYDRRSTKLYEHNGGHFIPREDEFLQQIVKDVSTVVIPTAKI